MTSDVSLRPAVVEDREFLFDVHKESMGPYVEELFGPWDDSTQWEFFDRWFRPEHTFIIRLGDEDVGVIAFEDRGDELYITRIEVHPDRQNLGVGTAVILRILEQATEAGKAVTLHVFAISLARSLYRRLGFSTMSEEDGRLFMKAVAAQGVRGSGSTWV